MTHFSEHLTQFSQEQNFLFIFISHQFMGSLITLHNDNMYGWSKEVWIQTYLTLDKPTT